MSGMMRDDMLCEPFFAAIFCIAILQLTIVDSIQLALSYIFTYVLQAKRILILYRIADSILLMVIV